MAKSKCKLQRELKYSKTYIDELRLKDYKKSKMILGMSSQITKLKDERYTFFVRGLAVGFLLCLLAGLFFKYIGA